MTDKNSIANKPLQRWGTSYIVEMHVDGVLKQFFHGINLNDDITLEPIKKQGFSTYYYEKPFKTGFYFINEFEYHFDELYPLVTADVKFNSEYQQKREQARKAALETMRPELGDIATALIGDPLTPEQKTFIIETCRGGNIGAIRRKLSKKCSAEELNRYTWQAICDALKEIREARQTQKEPLTPLQTMIYEAIKSEHSNGRPYPVEELLTYLGKNKHPMARTTLEKHIERINDAGYNIILKPRVGYFIT